MKKKIVYNETPNGAGVNHKTGVIKEQDIIPDAELIQFATDFSENYRTQKTDIYYSKFSGGKYRIDYQKEDNMFGKRNFSWGHTTGNFIFSKDQLITYNKNFVFYMVIWLWIFGEIWKLQSGKDYVFSDVPKELTIYEQADTLALKYYLSTKRSKKDIAVDFLKTIEKAMTIMNTRRAEYYIKTLK